MPLMIKLNRNVVRVYLCLDNGHFITVFTTTLSVTVLFYYIPHKEFSTFNEFGIISIDTVKNDINENLKNTYLELFGGNNDK